MSALGQERTFALQKVMSALPPKADIRQRANIEHRKVIRSPRGRHRIMSPGMSVEQRIRPVPCSAYKT
jgi:hypothetical protein